MLIHLNCYHHPQHFSNHKIYIRNTQHKTSSVCSLMYICVHLQIYKSPYVVFVQSVTLMFQLQFISSFAKLTFFLWYSIQLGAWQYRIMHLAILFCLVTMTSCTSQIVNCFINLHKRCWQIWKSTQIMLVMRWICLMLGNVICIFNQIWLVHPRVMRIRTLSIHLESRVIAE